jgi:glutamate racemase
VTEVSAPPTTAGLGAGSRLPIGVLDSGVGGLSVCRAIRRHLPGADLLYFADSAYAPYGEQSPELVRRRTLAIAEALIRRGAGALVVACNTATAAAVEPLREAVAVPVIAMEPAVKPAAAATRKGVVGVLATTGTVSSARFAALLDRFAGNIEVRVQPCPGWVERVERGELDGSRTEALVARFVRPLTDAGADTLVLGCTHYPFLAPVIAEIAGPEIALIETSDAVARQLYRRLEENGLLAPTANPGDTRLFTSACADTARAVVERLWPECSAVQRIDPDAG